MSPIPAASAPLPPVAARFVRYVQIDTQSDPASTSAPTTERQKDLSRLLLDELQALNIDAQIDEIGYVYAELPSTLDGEAAAETPRLGLVAHVDTSPDEPGGPVRPLLHQNYSGEVIELVDGVTLDPKRQPDLLKHRGHDVITSDGTTLLGSDDKAGVAVLMQLAEDLLHDDAPRPELRILFTVDEEVGRGVDHLDLDRFGADVAYTVDGGPVGELSSETFNAAEAVVTVRGVTVHPGYAKGVLVNAVAVLADFITGLPADEAPDTTEKREGYFYPHTITRGETGQATVRVLLRDFDDDGMDRRKAFVKSLADEVAARHGAEVEVEITDSYRNMLRYIEDVDVRTVDFAVEAAKAAGIEPVLKIVRGGTDGARLSEMGIPTPNLFTGGHDFHSRFEWNTVQNLETTLEYVKTLVRYWGEYGRR